MLLTIIFLNTFQPEEEDKRDVKERVKAFEMAPDKSKSTSFEGSTMVTVLSSVFQHYVTF